jgi:Mn-dependent DtxR family transcriptional regulator
MDFDRLLAHFDDEAVQQEQVGLIFYYLEHFESQDEVTQSDVKDVIRRTKSTISTSTVSTYFARLNNDSWITSTENDSCRLTHAGEEEVEELLNEDALDNHREEDDLFIETESLKDKRYEELIAEINGSYRYRIYSGTMVLTRKLLEDMIFQILKTHYVGVENDMYYDQENGRHYSFDDLITNLKDGVPTLRQYARELDRDLVEDIRDLKEKGNSGAHALRVNFSEEEMENLSSDVTRMVEILYEVLRGVRIREEQET